MSVSSLAAGLAAAVGASVLFNVGLAVQAIDARAISEDDARERLGLLGQLARRRRWLAGTAVVLLGWPLQVLALSLAPLVVVEPALALGLLVLLVLGARLLHEPVGRREIASVVALVASMGVIAVAAPDRSAHVASPGLLAAVLGVLTVGAFAPQVWRRSTALTVMIAAGVGFALGAVTTKLAVDALATHDWLVAVAWALTTAAASGIGLANEMRALRLRPAIQVGPVGFGLQTLVPVACAPLLFGESLSRTPLHGGLLFAGVGGLLAAVLLLTRSPAVAAWSAGDQKG